VVRASRLVVSFLALAAFAFAASPSFSQLPVSGPVEVIEGDWVIQGAETRENADLFVQGNITIEAGGSLELRHTKLVMGKPSDRWGIPILDIRPGGSFKMLATDLGGSTLTSNETWVWYKVNGTFESRGSALHRNLIEWVWGENAWDPENQELVPALPDGGSRSGIRLDHNAVGTITYTDVQQVGIRHFIVSDASLTLEHVTLKANNPALSGVKVALQGVAAARSSQVTLRDVTIEPAHTGVYVISAENVLIEDSTIEGGIPLGQSGTSPVALQAKRGVVTVRGSTLTAPGNVVLVESNATVTLEDSTLRGYANIGLSALGTRAGSAFAGTPDITLRRVTFEPGVPGPTQNGVQTVFTQRLVVEESVLSGHKSNGIAAVNTTTVLRNSELRSNQEWGAWLHGGVLEAEGGNDFGSGLAANRLGRILKDLTLYVRVLDGDGRPLSNATVKAFDGDGDEVFSDLTRGPNPNDPRSDEKEGWLLDPHYLLAFRRLSDGTSETRVPYTLEASKRGYPTKSVVLDDLRWQRIGIALEGEEGETEPIVGGDAVENPFQEQEGFIEGPEHDHGAGAQRLGPVHGRRPRAVAPRSARWR
jgi:hypothetical protein